MKVCFACGYYSDLAHKLKKRPEDYWDAYFFCWAVKTGRFHKEFLLHKQEGKLRITKDNIGVVRPTFGGYVARCATEKLGGAEALLVPVPSKDATPKAKDSRSWAMVREAMVGTAFADRVMPAVSWTQELDKAHEGGARTRLELKPFLSADPQVKGKSVILVDDLLSKGGTMLSTKEILEEAGATVLGGVTCGKTIYDFETKPFGMNEFDLVTELADYAKAAAAKA